MSDRILVVDDDPQMRAAMGEAVRRAGLSVETAADGREALAALVRQPFPVMVTDLRMPNMDGRALLEQARAVSPATRVIVVTAFGTVASAVECVKNGAADYVLKPFTPTVLVDAIRSNLTARTATRVVAEDHATRTALARARQAAVTDATVLLEAESGAGKEVFARFIHEESSRREGPFVAVNCAALPRELLEAELFGHVRGAFTGAHRDRKGHFQMADGGTLLLDEIGEMDPALQARLLRVLQDHVVHPVGRENPLTVDVRMIAATNRDLRREVGAGRFREDLYYRLRVFAIHIPPLRERPADIEPLARLCAEQFGGSATALEPAALERLIAHPWPGNVRELQNTMQRAAILAAGGPIGPAHIEIDPAPLVPRDPESPEPDETLTLDGAERETIRRILERTDGNRKAAAAALGISPRTLRHKLKRYRDAGQPVPEPV